MIEVGMMPTLSPQAGTYLVYNPGTEYCDTIIRVAGIAPNGITITNDTTGDVCKIIALPVTGYVEVNGEDGSVKNLPVFPDEYAFEYHDEGYIRLAPCTPYVRNAVAVYSSGSNVVTLTGATVTDDMVGSYIYLNKEWLRIISTNDETSVIVSKNMAASSMEITIITKMNEITVECDDGNLT